MRIQFVILFFSLISFLISPAQDTLKNNLFYYEPLGWKIFIPNEFKPIPQHELQTMGNQAADLFFINDSVVNVVNSSFLFAVKSDDYHYMDVKVVQIPLGETEEFFTSWKSGFDLLIKSTSLSLQNAKFDSLSYEESISGVVFNVQRFYLQINEKQQIGSYSFLAFLRNRAMSVNFVVMDSKKENLLLTAFRKSTFDFKKQAITE